MADPLGSAPGIIIGVGVGTAAAAAIEPAIEPARQKAWQANPNNILDPSTLAQLAAQGAISLGAAQATGNLHGLTDDKIAALVYLAQATPDLALVLELWRRDKIGVDLVDHALAKESIDQRYWAPLKELFNDRLGAPVIALAIVRGIMRDPGFLPVGPPTTEGKVRAFPVSPLDPLAEAKAVGIDSDRLFIETAIAGRPMGPEGAARAVFRDILERVDYDRAIAEGDIRNEWADAIFEASRAIPSASNFVNYRLRGWTDDAGMFAGTARHGMSEADTEVLFKEAGRPLSWHQIWIGLQRGGVYNGPTDQIAPAFLKGLQESDIRPEWYNLAWAQRYNYESVFVMRALVEGGDLTAEQAHQDLLDIGWRPDRAASVSKAWGAKAGVTKDPWTTKAHQQLWTALHKAYVGDDTYDDAKATTLLEAIGLTFDVANTVLYTWSLERTI